MADNPVTKQEVYTAANQLAAEGIMPSIMSIRKTIGERGSESTILKYLREWKMDLLRRNNAGCVFCHATDMENKMLRHQIEYFRTLLDSVKQTMMTMVKAESPEKIFNVTEQIGSIQ